MFTEFYIELESSQMNLFTTLFYVDRQTQKQSMQFIYGIEGKAKEFDLIP
jgi:hypothetical protein